MASKHQNRRLGIIALCAVALGVGVWMLGQALRSNTQFFYDPSEIAAPGFAAATPTIRIGGLVVEGSVRKGEGLFTEFDLEDFEGGAAGKVTVRFDGALPDLFREGQGIVVVGAPERAGVVKAEEVLAKHDENYKPAT
ncbi:cytochrome c maturation protein CcmE [Fretibacter rubidus]|uniref:cytochrome c maturation protein CcmE n=1 Tax=Fretibacter rubidus TaxID=570162 RepID=UPI00352B1A28